ncbi:MAG: bifunctional indole-3-glycerol phosphate synthase/phosphoribosylanthranilate isomerase [Spirochaetaceae bacterium]
MPQADILRKIADLRRRRLEAEGPALGAEVPAEREVPLRPFFAAPEIICEIKRRSPSAGSISQIPDPVEQAERYLTAGAPSVSVLTEEDHFGGSLDDLVAVKRAFPQLAVLRKDFLFDRRDLELSYRAGADAVLLIASMLEADQIAEIFAAAEDLGMAVLAEAHDREDLAKLRPHRPALVGINSRDLTTFRVDPMVPISLAPEVDWDCRLVFESGIYWAEQVRVALEAGFDGILVGEAVVREPGRIGRLIAALEDSPRGGRDSFWALLARRRSPDPAAPGPAAARSRPLVKVCGITREEDARLAAELGADLLGFIIADSPRELPESDLRALLTSLSGPGGVDCPRIGVLVARKGRVLDERRLLRARALLKEGLLNAVQLHGDELSEECALLAYPYYKAIRPRSAEDLEAGTGYRSPRVLLDGFSAAGYGGTGTAVAEELVDSWRETRSLWLAGGITPDNVKDLIRRFEPELLDVASGVEASAGVKDRNKLIRLFKEIEHA